MHIAHESLNLEGVRTFVETVERGSFAAVARARGVAPSSVSRLVAELEADLAVRLFQRTTRRLSLTEAGQAYLARVGPLLEELERARDEARDLGAAPRGRLRVAVASAFAQLHVARWLPAFLGRYPELEVELVIDARYTDLVSERIDVAIRLGQVQVASAVAVRLCAMPRAVVASPARLAGRRLRPEDVAAEPCLVFPHDGAGGAWKFRDGRGRVREHVPRARVTAADGLVLRRLALGGEGLALLPRWLCAEDLAAGSLVDVFPRHDVTATELDASVSLVYASRAYLPLKVRAFVDFVRALFERGAPWEAPPRRGSSAPTSVQASRPAGEPIDRGGHPNE